MYTEITSRENLDQYISQNQGNLIVVYTTKTCGFCRMIKLELEKIREEGQVKIAVFDVTEKSGEIRDKNIVGVPYIEYYKDSTFLKDEAGYKRSDELLRAFS